MIITGLAKLYEQKGNKQKARAATSASSTWKDADPGTPEVDDAGSAWPI